MSRESDTIPEDGRALRPDELVALESRMGAIVDASRLFKNLDERGRAELLGMGYLRTVTGGTVLVREGDEQERVMYLVKAGRVRVETTAPSGPVHLADLGAGACVGEVGLLAGGPSTATVTALELTELVAFPKRRFERFLNAHPVVRTRLESLVDARARDTIEKIIG
ncbi:MAG: cyclic nucleotide-binding domain-containing protein [Myxococcota bacterium]